MKRVQRFIIGVLISTLLFLQYADCTTVQAAPIAQTKSQYVNAAENRLVELANVSITGGDQRTLINDLQTVLEYAMYFDFLNMNKAAEYLNISKNELTVYAKQLNAMYKAFNAAYSNTSESFMYLQLNNGKKKFNYTNVCKYTSESLSKDVEEYINSYLMQLTQVDENTLKVQYTLELSRIYQFTIAMSDTAETIANWVENEGLSSSVANSISQMIDAINTNESYSHLLGIGAAVESQKSEEEITVDTMVSFIENLTDAVIDDKGNLQIEATPKLSLAYLAIFASSAVYTPFVSHTGCAEFMDALEALPKTEDSADLILLYNSTKGYKKPLYRRELDKVGDPTGSATQITLEKFVEDIESGATASLCTVLGNLQSNGVDWVYTQDGKSAEQKAAPIVNFNGENQNMTLDDYNGAVNVNINVNGTGSSGGNGGNGRGDNINTYTSPSNGGTGAGSSGSGGSTETEEDTETGRVENWFSNLQQKFVVNADVTDGFSDSEPILGTSGGRDVYAHDTVTDESAMSAPVMFYGTKYARAVDNLTTALMYNVLKTESWAATSKDADSSYLYINAYGDIVLADDTVVLPGSANPLFYKGKVYNPFTVAFMNSYPSVLKNTSRFKLASKSDVGKYLAFGVVETTGEYTSFVSSKTTSISTVETQGPITFPLMYTDFTSNYGTDRVPVFKTRKLLFGEDISAWEDTSKYNSYCPFIMNTILTINGESVFPYDATSDTTKLIAKAIANSMFAYYGVDDTTFSKSNQKKLNDAYIVDALIINALSGTNNAKGYQDDTLLKYDTYVSNSATRKYKSLLSLSNNLLNNLDSTSGVIGIKSVYDNKVAGNILNVFNENMVFCFFVVILVLLFFFSKVRLDLFQCVIFAGTFVVATYAYLNVFPSVMPAAFNLFTNNVVQNLSYEILSMEAEHYSFDKSNTKNVDSAGNLDLASTSITLYKVEGHDKDDLASSIGMDASDVTGGSIGVINEPGGVYVKNDEICVNTNILFDTLSIDGKVGADYSYKLSSKKTVSNNVDYYVPYYQIVDSLIGKVNSISEIYSIPRKTSTYANGEVKDNYLLYSYVNSKPFVTPGDYGYVMPSSGADWTDEELAAYTAEATVVEQKLKDTFGNNVDWLGISGWIYKLSDAERKTLWAQTMQNLGYYDQYWNPNKDRMDDLVSYVNYQTKKFVYDVSDQIGTLSDDVMIKVVALRALIALTQRASDFGHWMYPFTVNYEEMRIDNVLSSIFISDYSRYVDMNMDVAEYILSKHGWLNLIVFDVVVVLLFVVVSIVNWIVPMFYLLLAVLVAARLFIGQDFKAPLKGYLKASFIVMCCSTALSLSVLCVKAMNGATIGIYFLLIALLFIMYILLTLILSVVRNFSDFGNAKLSLDISGKLDAVRSNANHFSRKDTSYTNNLVYNKEKKMKNSGGRSRGSRYSLDNGVEDFYEYYDEPHYEYFNDIGADTEVASTDRSVETEREVDDLQGFEDTGEYSDVSDLMGYENDDNSEVSDLTDASDTSEL